MWPRVLLLLIWATYTPLEGLYRYNALFRVLEESMLTGLYGLALKGSQF